MKKLITIIDPRNKTPEQIFDEYKKALEKLGQKKQKVKPQNK